MKIETNLATVIYSSLGSSLFTINNIVRATTKRINTKYELDDVSDRDTKYMYAFLSNS